MSVTIANVSDGSFDTDVLQSETPTLVDFWAAWCGPCKAIAPLLSDVANEYEGRLKVVKMDVDANQSTPASHGVRGIPTLLLFKNGKVEATKVGAMSKAQLTSWIDQYI